MSLSAVVQHLEVLQISGLVSSEKRGRVRTCQIEPGALGPVERWIGARRSSWESASTALASTSPKATTNRKEARDERTIGGARHLCRRAQVQGVARTSIRGLGRPKAKARWFVDPDAHLELDFRIGGANTAGAPRRMATPSATKRSTRTSSRPSASSTPTTCTCRRRGSQSRWPRWSSHPWTTTPPAWSSPSRVRSSMATSPRPGGPRGGLASSAPWKRRSKARPREPERHPSLIRIVPSGPRR